MIIIDHRRNTLTQLGETPLQFGVEIDLRNHGSDIIVTHDPFHSDGPLFSEWLAHFRHRFLILNVKEEGLEDPILNLLEKQGIRDFFFLDESFPFIRRWALLGVSKFALRVSEFEDKKTALNLAAWLKTQRCCVDWVWVDSFSGQPLGMNCVTALKEAGFKLCFVSPELHPATESDRGLRRVEHFIRDIQSVNILPDAVCSRFPHVWQAAF